MLGFDKNDRRLIFNLFKLNLKDKYTASALGGVWAIINPIIMLSIFTFIFGFVYKSKLPGADTTLAYCIWLISGYGPWLATSEALLGSSLSVVSGSGLVKNMAFKTEVLPVSVVLTAIVPLLVSMAFLSVIMLINGSHITWTALLVIPVIILQFYFLIALSFYLSSITVFIRDIGIVLPNILMMLLFLTPIFYYINTMPHIIRIASYANPFYILAEGIREPLIYHVINEKLLFSLAYVFILTSILYFFGLRLFRRVKGYFNSAL